jgi:hypothetical protein
MPVLLPLLVCLSSLLWLPNVAAAQAPVAEVTIGAYINDIQSIDLREHSYAADIYIWFRWRDATLKPYETVEMVNPFELWGHVSKPQYDQPIELPDGEFYQVIRVQGKFSHKFFFTSYPFDRQELIFEFEDSANETNRLRFVADRQPMAVNANLKLPGYEIGIPRLSVKSVNYPTQFGDLRLSEPNSYSRVSISLPIRRPIFNSFIKMLLPVFCVVLAASLMLRLKATYVDARIGVGITALLTVVAMQLAANDTMPNVDYLVLMDKIDVCAYAYVLAGLAIVLATVGRVDRGEIDSANRLQHRGFWIISVGFVVIVSVLIINAVISG